MTHKERAHGHASILPGTSASMGEDGGWSELLQKGLHLGWPQRSEGIQLPFPPCLGLLASCSAPVCVPGRKRPAHLRTTSLPQKRTYSPRPTEWEMHWPDTSRQRGRDGLTCEWTGRPRPRLSETTRVMTVLRTVARNVLTPKTRAQSSLEREDAI